MCMCYFSLCCIVGTECCIMEDNWPKCWHLHIFSFLQCGWVRSNLIVLCFNVKIFLHGWCHFAEENIWFKFSASLFINSAHWRSFPRNICSVILFKCFLSIFTFFFFLVIPSHIITLELYFTQYDTIQMISFLIDSCCHVGYYVPAMWQLFFALLPQKFDKKSQNYGNIWGNPH